MCLCKPVSRRSPKDHCLVEADSTLLLFSIYVHSSIYDEFASRLAEKVEAFKVGNPFDSETTHGPLIHSKAVDKTDAHVKDAVEKGAKVLVGGKKLTDLGENFYAPTVLTDVQHCAINEDETFGKLSSLLALIANVVCSLTSLCVPKGPVAALYRFDSESEVIDQANDTDVGLAGYFFSRDIGRIWRVAEALEVGMVGIK